MSPAILIFALLAPIQGGPSQVHSDVVSAQGVWVDHVELPAGLVLIRLTAPKAVDADLQVREPRGTIRVAASHLPSERLLVRGPGRFRIQVRAPARAAFRLTLTAARPQTALLRNGDRLRVGGSCESVLLRAPERTSELIATREGGQGDLDLIAFDASLRMVRLAEIEGSRERLRLGTDVCWIQVGVRGSASKVRLQLGRARPPRDLESFLKRLPQTPDQRRAIAALRQNPDFLRIRAYLEGYPGGLPLQLRVVPGLKAHGVERFGTYSQGVLTINPTKREHRENPQELVDTLIHELLHALLAMPRADGFPLASDVLDATHDPVLRETLTSPLRRSRLPATIARYLDAHYGESASNPRQDFTDINAGAQRLLVKVIRDNLRRTRCGRETLVFKNVREREATAAK
ncbi:MAG: hypothetical protein JKY65_23495 [Planctomycetes bacterium]|nr:hypothetical protein [Planctomycetota bacterium]